MTDINSFPNALLAATNSIHDQELGSSITQENKFLNNRFNQIGESEIDADTVGAAIQAISKAPLPVPVSTTSKYRLNQYSTLRGLSTAAPGGIATATTTTTSFPANHKRLKIKKISTSKCAFFFFFCFL